MQSGVPIQPSDIPAAKAAVIPEFVIDAFNECIAKKYANGRARVSESDVQKNILAKCAEHGVAFEQHFLDIELLYEKNGWQVRWDTDFGAFEFIAQQSK